MVARGEFDDRWRRTRIVRCPQTHLTSWPPWAQPLWAIVLLLVCRESAAGIPTAPVPAQYHIYDVFVTRQSDTYHPRTYRALLATSGEYQRIAFYWLGPTAECEQMDALAFSDLLFYPDKMTYWHHKDPNQRHTLPLKPSQTAQATGKTLESALARVLELVVRNRATPLRDDDIIPAVRFFQGARDRACLDWAAQPTDANRTAEVSGTTFGQDGYALLDQLPFGRKYSKQVELGGDLVWRLSKATVPLEKVRISVKPRGPDSVAGQLDMADPNTLGRWSVVPALYRRYWSLRDRGIRLRREPCVTEAQNLDAQVVSCLHESLPDELKLAFRELHFTVSLLGASEETLSAAAREYFLAYVCLAQEPAEKDIVELGYIAQLLRRRWSDEQTRDFVLPLLRPVVDPKAFSDREFIKDAVLRPIALQGATSPWYAKLVLEVVADRCAVDAQSLADLAAGVGRPPEAAGVPGSEPNTRGAFVPSRSPE